VRVVSGAEMPPSVAEMFVTPGVEPLARPLLPTALLMGPTAALLEPHVTWVVMFWVDVSV
jgi:hypothetical protein